MNESALDAMDRLLDELRQAKEPTTIKLADEVVKAHLAQHEMK